MDKKFFIALILAAAVIAVTPILFPSPPAPVRVDTLADSAKPRRDTASVSPAQMATGTLSASPSTIADSGIIAPAVLPETTLISTPKGVYKMSNFGAAPLSVVLNDYENRTSLNGTRVELGLSNQPLIKYRLLTVQDTVALENIPFVPTQSGNSVTYKATVRNVPITINYTVVPDSYTVHVRGTTNKTATYLVVDLPTGFPSTETDTLDDQRNLAYAYKPLRDDAGSVRFDKLDPGEKRLQPGPLSWVAAKNKYFVVGLLAPDSNNTFSEITVTGGARTSKVPTNGMASTVVPVKDGQFAFDMYIGPQEWERLMAQGRDFDHVNPYGWSFMQGLVQPMANIIIRMLLWMHQHLNLSYGWVLVIFGVAIRLAMWPLNQRAMRSSLKMQELQPKLAEVQKKHQGDPVKQREAIMRVYQEAGTTPFAAMSGCLPMLIPMPILFALFFVFQNTIEFRGVPFLWLNDISIKDPYYILPVLMGLSMYLLSWIGMRNSPAAAQNPQAKMMMYVFPVMMTFVLLNMASGLNLYYTVQNIAALPQQWLIARERGKGTGGVVQVKKPG